MTQPAESAPIGTVATGPSFLRPSVTRAATLLAASLCMTVTILSGCKKQRPTLFFHRTNPRVPATDR